MGNGSALQNMESKVFISHGNQINADRIPNRVPTHLICVKCDKCVDCNRPHRRVATNVNVYETVKYTRSTIMRLNSPNKFNP